MIAKFVDLWKSRVQSKVLTIIKQIKIYDILLILLDDN